VKAQTTVQNIIQSTALFGAQSVKPKAQNVGPILEKRPQTLEHPATRELTRMKPNSRCDPTRAPLWTEPNSFTQSEPFHTPISINYHNFGKLATKSSFQGRIGSFKSPITHNTEGDHPKGLHNSDLQRKSKFNKFERGESSRSACEGPPSPRREVYCEVDEISFTIPDRIQSEISTRRSLRGPHPIHIQGKLSLIEGFHGHY
jgi:hypothetical protein